MWTVFRANEKQRAHTVSSMSTSALVHRCSCTFIHMCVRVCRCVCFVSCVMCVHVCLCCLFVCHVDMHVYISTGVQCACVCVRVFCVYVCFVECVDVRVCICVCCVLDCGLWVVCVSVNLCELSACVLWTVVNVNKWCLKLIGRRMRVGIMGLISTTRA
jgi:hypothetical protein